MMLTTSKALAVLAAISSTLANSPSPRPLKVTETYDELPPAVVAVAPVGVVNNLNYTAFSLNTVQAVQVGGVQSQSGKNRLVSNVLNQKQYGTPSISVAGNSKYHSFAPIDFYFGCTVFTTTAAATQATQCTVTVAGFVKNQGQEVAVASFTFTPPVSPVGPVPMQHAVLPDSFWRDLVNITLIQTEPTTTVLLFDSFTYNLIP